MPPKTHFSIWKAKIKGQINLVMLIRPARRKTKDALHLVVPINPRGVITTGEVIHRWRGRQLLFDDIMGLRSEELLEYHEMASPSEVKMLREIVLQQFDLEALMK